VGTYTQAEFPLRIHTPLGEDRLLLQALAGVEGVSRPFEFTLELLSEDAGITAADLLRKPVAIELQLPNEETRTVHGLVRRFVQLGRHQQLTAYRAEVVPWLWFLSLSSDCRIFQKQSVPQIVEGVFRDLGCTDFALRLHGRYQPRGYCVQYRESHLDFVSRLLEEEGIAYFFEHEAGRHTLVLADAPSEFRPCPNAAVLPMAFTDDDRVLQDCVTRLEAERSACLGQVTLADYDALQPRLDLRTSIGGDGPRLGEAYDYPGGYRLRDEGERYARVRLEERHALGAVVRGTSTSAALCSGTRFELQEHYSDALNGPYTVLEVRHEARAGDRGTWGRGAYAYHNTFIAVPFATPYRPPRTTPRPVVRGAQTAVVVGPRGEDIWTDRHGRIKVQFHWDRLGKNDEGSSCWVRVASPWAGKNWGAVHLPRIGQEVLVDFLEGDPDRPIVVGGVYNADQTPPFTLPADKTQSGLRSRSTLGGGPSDANELRFEDKRGEEEVLLHAQRDLVVEVEHDERRTVEHDRSAEIRNDDRLKVEHDRSAEIQGKDTCKVSLDRKVEVGGTDALEVTRTITIEAGQSITLKANAEIRLEAAGSSITIGPGGITVQSGAVVTVQGALVKIN